LLWLLLSVHQQERSCQLAGLLADFAYKVIYALIAGRDLRVQLQDVCVDGLLRLSLLEPIN
jgi:hypothetical protein